MGCRCKSGMRFIERDAEVEMHFAAADSAADLCVGSAQFALAVVWQRLILRLFGQRVCDGVRDQTLLGEQQGEGKQ